MRLTPGVNLSLPEWSTSWVDFWPYPDMRLPNDKHQRHVTQHNDIQHNEAQHNRIECHNTECRVFLLC